MTKKEEKKSDLEGLLNSLIEKGWKPRGKNYGVVDFLGALVFVDLNDGRLERKNALDLRKLTSKESLLWQFVCENGMVNVDETEVYYFWLKRKGTLDRGHYYLSEAGEDIRTNNFEYRLIESSLKDESELEDFLLSNIKVDDN